MSLMLLLSYLGYGVDMHTQRKQDYPKPICMINIGIHVTESHFWDRPTPGDRKLEWLFGGYCISTERKEKQTNEREIQNI